MLADAAFFLWCCWGFAGCGLLPAWRQGWRGPTLAVSAVLASFAVLFTGALLLQLLSVPLGRAPWLGAATGLSLLACLLPRGPVARAPPGGGPGAAAPRAAWLLGAAAAMALVVVAYRAAVQPLTGPDTVFRWDFLARQIVREGGFGFYPAFTDADFTRYMWPESIPPLLSLLYAWSYLGAGSVAASATAPVVILVAFTGFALVGMLAARIAGRAAAWWAVAILAGSAVNSWSVSMGQETGLTTLGVLALAWAMGDGGLDPDWRLAGLAAAVAGLSRDYGVALAVAGAAWLLWRRRPGRELAGFIAVVAAALLPWYARVWARTGNPFYDVDLFGSFPVNPMHAGLMRSYVERYGIGGHAAERVGELLPLLWPLGAGVLLAALAGVRVRGAWKSGLRGLALLWTGLWLWSLGYTAGGLSFSLRVLSPVLALLSVSGGVALSRVRGGWSAALAAGLVLLAAEASGRALTMMRMPLAIPVRAWAQVGVQFSALRGDASHNRAAAIIGARRVLVDNAYVHAFLTGRGVKAVPPWSPALGFLRAPGIDMAAAVRRLHAMGVDYIWLTAAPDLRGYFDRYAFFQGLDPWLRPVLVGDHWVLFAFRDAPAGPSEAFRGDAPAEVAQRVAERLDGADVCQRKQGGERRREDVGAGGRKPRDLPALGEAHGAYGRQQLAELGDADQRARLVERDAAPRGVD